MHILTPQNQNGLDKHTNSLERVLAGYTELLLRRRRTHRSPEQTPGGTPRQRDGDVAEMDWFNARLQASRDPLKDFYFPLDLFDRGGQVEGSLT
jgi:hypothetical protein